MPTVDIAVNQRSYTVACDAGEEDRVRELAAQLDARFADLPRSGASEAHLLVLVGLLMVDEIADLSEKLASSVAAQPSDSPPNAPAIDQAALAKRLSALASRIEAVADRGGAA